MSLVGEPLQLSDEVRAVQAELLARGVVILDEAHGRKDERSLHVASYRPEWAEAVPEMLGAGWEVVWVAKTPREIVPARIHDYSDRGMGGMKLGIVLGPEEHIDEVLLAEDDDKIVVAAYVCAPALPPSGHSRAEVAKVYAARDIGDRLVIDRFSGEVLRRVN